MQVIRRIPLLVWPGGLDERVLGIDDFDEERRAPSVEEIALWIDLVGLEVEELDVARIVAAQGSNELGVGLSGRRGIIFELIVEDRGLDLLHEVKGLRFFLAA